MTLIDQNKPIMNDIFNELWVLIKYFLTKLNVNTSYNI
jgi:hypothetical protein